MLFLAAMPGIARAAKTDASSASPILVTSYINGAPVTVEVTGYSASSGLLTIKDPVSGQYYQTSQGNIYSNVLPSDPASTTFPQGSYSTAASRPASGAAFAALPAVTGEIPSRAQISQMVALNSLPEQSCPRCDAIQALSPVVTPISGPSAPDAVDASTPAPAAAAPAVVSGYPAVPAGGPGGDTSNGSVANPGSTSGSSSAVGVAGSGGGGGVKFNAALNSVSGYQPIAVGGVQSGFRMGSGGAGDSGGASASGVVAASASASNGGAGPGNALSLSSVPALNIPPVAGISSTGNAVNTGTQSAQTAANSQPAGTDPASPSRSPASSFNGAAAAVAPTASNSGAPDSFLISGSGTDSSGCRREGGVVLPQKFDPGLYDPSDYRWMWNYRRTGKIPGKPPSKKRVKTLMQNSNAFVAINPNAQDPLAIGDFVVMNSAEEALGTVSILKSYDPKTGKATVAQVLPDEHYGPETPTNLKAGKSYVGGLYVLRVASSPTLVCSGAPRIGSSDESSQSRAPASQSKK